MRKLFEEIKLFIRRAISSPVGELTRAQRVARFWIDLVWHCARALRHDRAGEMAAALTYRTIFSLIPLLVTLLLVFQAFRGLDEVRSELEPMVYKFMGIDDLQTSTPIPGQESDDPDAKTPEPAPAIPDEKSDGKPDDSKEVIPRSPDDPLTADAKSQDEKQPGAPPKVVAEKQFKFRVDEFLGNLTTQVASLDFKSIGVVGLVLFIWAAIDLVVTLELNFNRVFNSPDGRPWLRRIPIYWAVITLGPVLVWLSLSIAGRLVGAAEQVPFLGTVIQWFSSLFALAASWLLLFLLYKLMPNTNVHAGSALAGAFVAAVLWELGKFGFGLYVNKALPYAKIYGALGLIPLFLFWVYITWIIVLFGLELTYTLQAMNSRRFKYELPTQAQGAVPGDPQWIIPIMAQIGQSFVQGQAIDSHSLADRLSLPDRAIVDFNLRLEKAGLIHRVQHADDALAQYSLSLPPDQIRIGQLLEVADAMRHASDPSRQQAGWALLRTLAKAQADAAADMTLAALLKTSGQSAPVEAGHSSSENGSETGLNESQTRTA